MIMKIKNTRSLLNPMSGPNKKEKNMKITIELNKDEISNLQNPEYPDFIDELRKTGYNMVNLFCDNNKDGMLKKVVIEEA